MKKRIVYIAISILTLAFGFVVVFVYQNYSYKSQPNANLEQKTVLESSESKSRFRFISGYESIELSYAIYDYQILSEEDVFKDNCENCSKQAAIINDCKEDKKIQKSSEKSKCSKNKINIYKDFRSPEQTQYLFNSNSENEIIEKSEKFDLNGLKIGKKAISVYRNEKKEIINVRLFWTEGSNFWSIDAPNIEIGKEFEQSQQFKLLRKEMKSESNTK